MSEEVDPKLLSAIADVFEGTTMDLQFESLFKMLTRVGVILGQYRVMMLAQGFSTDWIEGTSTTLFNRLFTTTPHNSEPDDGDTT